MTRNSFEALCELGAAEGWHLYPRCGSCCSWNYRHGFAALIRGLDPTSSDWPIHRSDVDETPMSPDHFDVAEQGVLAGIIASVDLLRLSRRTPTVVWVGVLDLALKMTCEVERTTGAITARLMPKLIQLCHGRVRDRLIHKYLDRSRRLVSTDLREVAESIEETRRQPAASRQSTGIPSDPIGRSDDAPRLLSLYPESEWSAAMARGILASTGQQTAVDIVSVTYGAWDRCRVFKQPVQIRAKLSALGTDPDRAALQTALSSIGDQKIADGVADALGNLAVESYRCRLVSKTYEEEPRSLSRLPSIAVTLLVARDVSIA